MKNSLSRYTLALWTYRTVLIILLSLGFGALIAFNYVSLHTKIMIFNYLMLTLVTCFVLGMLQTYLASIFNAASPFTYSLLLLSLNDRDFGDSPSDLEEKYSLMTYCHFMIRMVELDHQSKIHRIMHDNFQIQSFKEFCRVLGDDRKFFDFFYNHDPIKFENKEIQEEFDRILKSYRRYLFFAWTFVRHCSYHGLRIQIPELSVCEEILETTEPDKMDGMNRIYRKKAKEDIPQPFVSY